MTIRLGSRKMWLGLVVGSALVLGTGVAFGSIPDSGGVIHACYKDNGQLRVIDTTPGRGEPDTCKNQETALTWNQRGPAGPAGATGAAGPKGDTGAAGAPGAKGDTGAQGPAGAQGPKGDTGATGAQGPKGATGENGAQGPKGETGATGAAGAIGAQGPKGDTGATGPAGASGAQGPKGDTGAQGPQGVPGAQGPKGDTGAPGPIGAPGGQGPKGDTGAQGPQGVAGAAGVSGYELVTSAGPVPSTYIAGTTIGCPAGKVAIGGGTYSDSLPGGYHVFTLISAPTDDGTAWRATVENDTNDTVNITQYAVCVNATRSPAAFARKASRTVRTLTPAPGPARSR